MTGPARDAIPGMDRALCALQSAITAREVYWPEHAAAIEAVRRTAELLGACLCERDSVSVMFLEDRVVCDDQELPSSAVLARSLGVRFRARGVECASISNRVGSADVGTLVEMICATGTPTGPLSDTRHIRFGALQVLSGGSGGGGGETASGLLEAHLKHPERIRDLWEPFLTGGGLTPDALEQTVGGLLGLLAATGGAAVPLAALKSHDEYTFVHTTNVAILSGALAEAIGLSQSRVRDVAIAAVLHDVGKERVPPAILNKNGKLNDDELRVMRQHPVEGAKMLATSPEVPDVAVIVAYEHHIHPDGTGYPVLAPGRKIHLSSRIVQLADVYDALATNRPYRAALPAAEIREIMGAKAGRVYDPDLLAAFFNGVVNRVDKTGPDVARSIAPAQARAAA